MNDRIVGLIDRFHQARGRGQESPEKLAVIGEIEDVNDPRVTEFLAAVAADPEEYDLARVESLKLLELRAMGAVERALVAAMLRKVLEEDEDPDVRNYAARALAGVLDQVAARQALEKHLFDREEDEDVRHNAFFALERGGANVWAIQVLRKCDGDEHFMAAAARVLKQWTNE